MRSFSDKEKVLLKNISGNAGIRFYGLFVEICNNQKLSIVADLEARDIRIYSRVIPSAQLSGVFSLIKEDIHRSVQLLQYFVAEGYISLYHSPLPTSKITIGQRITDSYKASISYDEHNTKEVLLDIFDQVLIVSYAFDEFIDNGFITNEEKDRKQSLFYTRIGLAVAIFIGLISILLSVSDSSVETFHKDFNHQAIKKEVIYQKLDSIASANKALARSIEQKEIHLSKLDSIISLQTELLSKSYTLRAPKQKMK